MNVRACYALCEFRLTARFGSASAKRYSCVEAPGLDALEHCDRRVLSAIAHAGELHDALLLTQEREHDHEEALAGGRRERATFSRL